MRAALCVVCFWAVTALAGEPSAVQRRVEAYLGSIDTPISGAQWRALGSEAGPVLAQVVDDEAALPTRRARALEGLGAVDASRAGVMAAKLTSDERAPGVLRSAALWTAGRVLPTERALALLTSALRDAKSRSVRATAARVLAQLEPRQACPAIQRQLARESLADRARFSQAVEKCKVAGALR